MKPFLQSSLLSAVLACSGCASSSVTGGGAVRTDGLGSDLRVFLDRKCLPEPIAGIRGFGAVTLGEIAVGAGKVAFNSFGRFLEEAGQPDINVSSGLASGFFYSSGETESEYARLNEEVRCVHIVRSGFGGTAGEIDENAPYAHLNLTSEPSFYALIRLDPAEDKSAHFRGYLEYAVTNRFERPGGELSRDISIALGFGLPASGAGENFSIGVIQLPGVQRGKVLGKASSKGLETGWLSTPPIEFSGEQVAFNLYVDVSESKRGNPFLADLGRVLQSDPVVRSLDRELRDAVFDRDKKSGRE